MTMTNGSDAAPPPLGPLPRHIEIWTDGSCRPNPGFGGWAAILRNPEGQSRTFSGGEAMTTNNRMELRAAIAGLSALKQSCRATVYSDSEYVVRGMTLWLARWQESHWRTARGKPVENADLWRLLAHEAERHDITWQWVQGHADNAMNTQADALANAARLRAAREG